MSEPDSLLQVRNLDVRYGSFPAVKGASFDVKRGRNVGLVGESGSGKSSVVSAMMRLLPPNAHVTGELRFDGRDLLTLTDAQMRAIRGARIAYVSQDPLSALNPVLTIGEQMLDIQHRLDLGRAAKRERAVEALARVRIPDPAARLGMYPHELSGGQRQRVCIAMAMMSRPDLLIADEATTALDATLELEIVELLRELQGTIGCSILFVTHHLGLVEAFCDDVVVMHNGVVRERGRAAATLLHPQDDYTRRLLECDPARIAERCRRLPTMADPTQKLPADPMADATRVRSDIAPLLAVEGLAVSFAKPPGVSAILGLKPRQRAEVVKSVSLAVHAGETVALVGESGSGKTTLARSVIGLVQTSSGSIRFDGQDLIESSASERRAVRRRIAMMFQDPFGSLSPRMSVADIVTEPLRIDGVATDPVEAERLLTRVGLPASFASRYPHELSGGQARRVGVARALAVSPELLIADEPTAGLDVSVQGEIVNLLMELREELGMAILIITHNLHVVRHISDRVAVMYHGEIVETAATDKLFAEPRHHYTRKLLAANLYTGTAAASSVSREGVYGS